MPSKEAVGIGSRFISRSLRAGACVVLAAAAGSYAQSSEQAYVIASGSGVQLRCGQGAGFYATRQLPVGQILLVTEQGGQWTRVSYPGGSEAYVAAEAVQVSGQWATLTSARSLRHVNPRTGKRGSWKPLLDAPLASGTRLSLIGTLEDSAQPQHKAYKVVAPQGAQAYVLSSAVRTATADEISLYLASVGAASGGSDLSRNVPSTGEETDPTVSPELGDGGREVTPALPMPQPTETAALETDPLEAAFIAVRKQPIAEAEYDELIGEYRKAIEALGDGDASEPVRIAYQQRLDLLIMQQRFQEARRTAAANIAELQENSKTVANALNDLDNNRRYVVIGRLTTSVVYNGERLPVMYRIQSVGDRIPRTLGYIKPSKAFELEAKIGRVVGIEGKSTHDQSLSLNIVTPTRVDVLTPDLGKPAEGDAKASDGAPAETPAKGTEPPAESSGG